MGDGDRRHVLALLRLAEALERRPGSSSCSRRTASRPSAERPCSCTPRCRSRRTGTGGRARARRRAPAGRCRTCRRRRRTRRPRRPRPSASTPRCRSARCALSTPLATAAAFSNATCIHGTFQAVRREARRRDLEAAGRVDDDGRALDRAEHGPDDHRDAAALAERVAAARAAGRRAGSRTSVFRRAIRRLSHRRSAGAVAGEDRADVLRMEVAAAEPVDVAIRVRCCPAVQRERDLGRERRRAAGRVGAVEHDHVGHVRRAARRRAGTGTAGTSGSSAGRRARPRRAARRRRP